MLLLSRRIGERIMVGHDIVITVNAIDGNQVRLGIDAPKQMTILREEIYKGPAGKRPM